MAGAVAAGGLFEGLAMCHHLSIMHAVLVLGGDD